MRKKIVSMLLCVSVLISLCACGSEKQSDTTESSLEKVESSSSKADSSELEKEEPATITVELYDRGTIPAEYGTVTDNKWVDYFKEAALEEANIDLEYMAVSRSDDAAKLQVLLAAGNEPDIFFCYEQTNFVTWASEGYLADLTEYLDTEAGQKLIDAVGQENVEVGTINGKTYAIAGPRAYTGLACNFLRKDLFDQVGVELDTMDGHYVITPTQLYDALIKIKEAGLVEYPFGMFGVLGYQVAVEGAFYSKSPADTVENLSEILEGNSFITEGRKEAIRFWNKCYNDGLINPDFILYNEDNLREMIGAGETAFWSTRQDGYTGVGECVDALYHSNPDAEIVAVELIQENGEHANYKKYGANDAYIMISSACEDVEAAIELLSWFATSEKAHLYTSHGIEGEHYALDENGHFVAINAEYTAKDRIGVKDLNMMFRNDKCLFGIDEAEIAEIKYATTKDALAKQSVIQTYTDALKIAQGEGRYAETPINTLLTAQDEWRSALAENMNKLYFNSIIAPSNQFDAVYDEAYQLYMDEGGRQLIEEKLEYLKQQ